MSLVGLIAALLLSACSGADEETRAPSVLDVFVGKYTTVSVTVLEDKCEMGATNDESPQIGDTFVATVSEDGLRLITDECKTSGQSNCIDHFPDDWTIAETYIENKHIDDLYDGNPEKPAGECAFTAYSHWTAIMEGDSMRIQLTIRVEPAGMDCTSFETSLFGCQVILQVVLERE